ncbi:MAG TPA: rhodanese-like domain-containing protein [Pyrinomonadaceae bacterium]|jgi:rhodanese-related sulfurtransferase
MASKNVSNGLLIVLTCVALIYQGASLTGRSQTKGGVALMSAEELKSKLDGNEPVIIIDVRSSDTYANSDQKIKGAIHVKVRRLKHRLNFAPLKDVPKDRQIVTYCSCPADESAIAAARILLESGYTRVRALKGGWREWVKISGQTESKPRGM